MSHGEDGKFCVKKGNWRQLQHFLGTRYCTATPPSLTASVA